MKTGLIYKIINKRNGNLYIGQTIQTVEKRWKVHVRDAINKRANTIIGRAIRKYGEEAFTIEIIVEKVPIIFLDTFEKYWINFYDTFNGSHGYNATKGGYGTFGVKPWNKGKSNIYSKETLQKMSDKKKGIIPTNLEQLKILAKDRVGLKHQNSKSANIYEYATNKLIAENVSITQWCRINGYNQGNLCSTARNLRKHYKGMYAKYNL